MSIERADFDAISEPDLRELVTAQVPEGLRFEYKSEVYDNSDGEKREFLKDISALANASGGHLILGISEAAGVATAIAGLGDVNADAELLRLEQIAASGLEPRISGLRMRAIPLAAGGHVLLIRVPRSWNPPHRVVTNRSNRFYIRHSAGVHEPNVEELRTLFTASTNALEQARSFRTKRLEEMRWGHAEHRLGGAARAVLHIVPVASLSHSTSVNLPLVLELQNVFRPIGVNFGVPHYNYHGVINERPGGRENGYTQMFRDGILEATKTDIADEYEGRQIIGGANLEEHLISASSRYIDGLRDLEVPPPLIVMITLEGVEGADYVVEIAIGGQREPPLPAEVLTLPECFVEDYGDTLDYHRALKPAFDAIWNAIGHPGSRWFDEDGRWVGPQRR